MQPNHRGAVMRAWEFLSNDTDLDEDLEKALDRKKRQLDNQAKVIANRKKALKNRKAQLDNRDTEQHLNQQKRKSG